MSVTRKFLCVVAAMVAAACRGQGPVDQCLEADCAVPLGTPLEISLAVGQEVRVDQLLRLGFVGVPNDSRCPTSVTCPWPGDAAVAIRYGLGMGPSIPDTLHTGVSPRSATFSGYRITLVTLGPYPYVSAPIPLDEYAVRLRVERGGK